MNALVIFILLTVLMLTGMPVSISLGLTVLTFLFALTDVPLQSVALKLFTGIEKFEIMAIPFFILAGNFLTHGGVAKRMIRFATSLVGHWYGGLGLSGVLACALFAAISGSSPATVVAIGSILLPAMIKAGFPNKFGAGVITTSGALGILIPPSIVMVMYSVATSTSVGALFMAGVVPGIVLALLLGLTTFYRAWKFKYPRVQHFPGRTGWQATVYSMWGLWLSLGVSFLPAAVITYMWSSALPASNTAGIFLFCVFFWNFFYRAVLSVTSKFTTFKLKLPYEMQLVWSSYWESVWGILLIILVMGGIYSGVFTATEAAAMSAVYAFVISLFVYRDMSFRATARVFLNSANMSAMLLYIITNAVLFSFIMTNENIPQTLAAWMLGQGLGMIAFLLVVNVVLLLAGNFMEPSSIVLIFAPILFPIAVKLGIDPVHFGILMVVNMEVGMCHPPVGLNLYVASGITKMGITELTVAVWPWLLTMLGFLVAVTYWPSLSIWLPKTMGIM